MPQFCPFGHARPKQAYFGLPGGLPQCCKEHRTEGMVDVINRHCAECTTRASYGLPGGRPTHCAKHHKPGTVNVERKQCAECNSTASYGLPGRKPTHCTKHREIHMISIITRRCALCNKVSNFGMPGGRGTHCNEHRTADMINVTSKRCESEACRDIRNLAYFKADGMSFCWGCFNALHPDKAKHKVRREQLILAELERLVPELGNAFSLLWDCRVPGGCSLKKPDYLARFSDRYLQVEVD